MLVVGHWLVMTLLILIKSARPTAFDTAEFRNEKCVKLKHIGIISKHGSNRADLRVHRIESCGYQFPAEIVYLDNAIALSDSIMTFMFHIENVRDPKNLRLTTTYLLHSPTSAQHPIKRVTDISNWKRESPTKQHPAYAWYRNINVVEQLVVNKRTVSHLNDFVKWMEIRVDIQGNATEEVTPCGPGIDEIMAENAHQLFVIAVPIEDNRINCRPLLLSLHL